MPLTKQLFFIWREVIDIIFPIECLGCKQEGKWLCEKCCRTIPINTEPYCLSCKTKTAFGEFCKKCKSNYNLDGVFIASDYDHELIKQGIKTLKYRFVYDISQELSQLLILFMQEQIRKSKSAEWLPVDNFYQSPTVIKKFFEAIVIPVPLHPKRLRWRGFNQAEKLSENFFKFFNLNSNSQNFRRIIHTKSQAKLNEQDRKDNLKNCFAWQGDNLQNKNIILIDDVCTTGHTLEECAKVLKQAGAGEVWGLVVAKG